MVQCGVDIIEIDRIKKSVSNPNFLKRVFTKEELNFFASKKNAPQTIAANFAAKEAISKALGTGIRNFSWKDISVLRNELGKPIVNFEGALKKIPEKYFVDVSLSHNKTQAIAFVVLLKKE